MTIAIGIIAKCAIALASLSSSTSYRNVLGHAQVLPTQVTAIFNAAPRRLPYRVNFMNARKKGHTERALGQPHDSKTSRTLRKVSIASLWWEGLAAIGFAIVLKVSNSITFTPSFN